MRARRQAVHQQKRGGDQAHTDRQEHTQRDLSGEAPRDQWHREHEPGQRQEANAGLKRRVAQHVLQVDREKREEREHPGADAEGREGHAEEGRIAEKGHVQHRPLLQPLDHDEDHEQDGAADQAGEDQCAAPAVRVAAQQAEDNQEERGGEGEEAPEVGARRLRVPRLVHLLQRDDHGEHPHRDVDEEHPPPAEGVGDDSADERPGGDRRAHGGAPDRDRLEPLRPAVLVADQCERGREQGRASDALERAGDVESGDVPRDSA